MERSELARRIGSRIKENRKRLRISQEELAFKADMHPSYLGCVERGEKCPTIETVFKISAALGVPLSLLISVEGSDENVSKARARINSAVEKVPPEKLSVLADAVEKLAELTE